MKVSRNEIGGKMTVPEVWEGLFMACLYVNEKSVPRFDCRSMLHHYLSKVNINVNVILVPSLNKTD